MISETDAVARPRKWPPSSAGPRLASYLDLADVIASGHYELAELLSLGERAMLGRPY